MVTVTVARRHTTVVCGTACAATVTTPVIVSVVVRVTDTVGV